MVVLCQMYRNRVRCFLGISVTEEDWGVPVWGLQARVQSATFCFKQMVFTWEESTLLTYAWAWKTHSLSIKGPGRFSLSDCGPVDNDSASCFVWNTTCHRSTAVVRAFEEHRFVVRNDKDSNYWQPHRCNCDQRWHKSSIHMVGGKYEIDTNNTQKKF